MFKIKFQILHVKFGFYLESGPATVTTDVQELLDTLNNLKLYGGGDCPEVSQYQT